MVRGEDAPSQRGRYSKRKSPAPRRDAGSARCSRQTDVRYPTNLSHNKVTVKWCGVRGRAEAPSLLKGSVAGSFPWEGDQNMPS